MKKVLAINARGELTYCSSPPDRLGKGRCNHLLHKREDQTEPEFMKEVEGSDLLALRKEKELESSLKHAHNSLPHFEYDREGCLLSDQRLRVQKEARGLQSKGPVVIKEGGEESLRFLKLDDINPSSGKHFLDKLDYKYSSISEELGSVLLGSISNLDDFDYINYSFSVVKGKGYETTGVLSDNYLQGANGEELIELVLSIEDSKRRPNEKIRVQHQEFIDHVIDSKDNESVLDHMVEYFGRHRVPEKDARDFILKQAAFDSLSCNYDRKGNSTNFVFVLDQGTGVVRPINIDYGRCYVLEVDKSFCDRIQKHELGRGETREGIIKDSAEFCMDKYIGRGGIFAYGNTEIKKNVDFILEKGFEPFKIDLGKLHEGQNKLRNKVKEYENGELSLFVEMKISMMNQILDHDEMRRLWRR